MGRTRCPIKLVPRVFDEEMKDPGNEFGCYILYDCYAITNNNNNNNNNNFEIKTNAKRSRRFDLSEVIFK